MPHMKLGSCQGQCGGDMCPQMVVNAPLLSRLLPQSPYMQASLERRREDWEEFLKEQQSQKEEVDEEHTKAVGRLSCQYSEMKKDLAKFSHF